MAEVSISHLEEFLDAIVSFPHDIQRILTRLKEVEGLHQRHIHELTETANQTAELLRRQNRREETNTNDITNNDSTNKALENGSLLKTVNDEEKELLAKLEEQFTITMVPNDEKSDLAQELRKIAQSRLERVEEHLLGFEEAVRLAQRNGELATEEEEAETSPEPHTIATPLEDQTSSSIKSNNLTASIAKRRIPPTGNEMSRRGGRVKRQSADSRSQGAPTVTNPTSTPNAITTAIGSHSTTVDTPTVINAASPPAVTSGVEPTYCVCNQVSYGEMIACDNSKCDIEWFHYGCVGLTAPPPGKWYCPICQPERDNQP